MGDRVFPLQVLLVVMFSIVAGLSWMLYKLKTVKDMDDNVRSVCKILLIASIIVNIYAFLLMLQL